jgi:hypothetical protein
LLELTTMLDQLASQPGRKEPRSILTEDAAVL